MLSKTSIMRGVNCLGATALVGAMLTGCQPTLMPTPIVFADSGIDPLQMTTASESATTKRLFYATDRTPRDQPAGPASTYSNDRDLGLRLGAVSVDLAPGMTWDALHDASLSRKRSHDPVPRLTALEEFGSLWLRIPPLQAAEAENAQVTERFAAEVEAELEASGGDEIFIFVHGFNTHFDDNCVIAAELHHYMGSRGVFMSYAWPSRGSLFAYSADKASALYSVRYFRLFLAFLAENTSASSINIIAHSAGAPVAVDALRDLCLMHFDEGTEAVQARYRIRQLILVAPDMDFGLFANAIHDEIVGVPERMSIYFSTRDKALDLSAWIYGFARLGEPLDELDEVGMAFLKKHPDVALIDVADAEKKHGSWLGHSYFHNDPWVSSDVIMLMSTGASPAERGLVEMDGTPIWGFPKDYPARAGAAAGALYR